MIDVATAILAIIPLLVINIPEPARRAQVDAGTMGEKMSFWEDFRAGLKYAWGWPGMLMLIGLVMMVNFLLTPAGSLLPLLVTDHFGGNALQLGWTESAFGAGVVIGGLVLGAWGGFKRRIITSLVGLLGLGLGFFSLGVIPVTWFPIATIAALFLCGLTLPICNGPIGAVMQASIEPNMQGRVFTLLNSLSLAMSPIGLMIAGPVSDALGIQIWYIAGGVITFLMGGLGFMIPAIMNIESERPGHPLADKAPKQQVEPA